MNKRGYVEIDGCPGYFVNKRGSVRSQRSRLGKTDPKIWRELRPSNTGHARVILYVDGVRVTKYVHRLVLETHVGPCPDGLECLHKDGNSFNNCLSNLHWGSRKENMADKVRHGTQTKGSARPHAKLTEADIPVIWARLVRGDAQIVIAEAYGVDQSVISRIFGKQSWAHVE